MPPLAQAQPIFFFRFCFRRIIPYFAFGAAATSDEARMTISDSHAWMKAQ